MIHLIANFLKTIICRSMECTSSVLEGLILFKEQYPHYRCKEIGKCIKDSATYIENKQRKNGSW